MLQIPQPPLLSVVAWQLCEVSRLGKQLSLHFKRGHYKGDERTYCLKNITCVGLPFEMCWMCY